MNYWEEIYKGRPTYYQDINDPAYLEIAKHVGKSDTVLDVGCGAGTLAHHLPNNKYLGLDSSPQAIEIASKKYNKNFMIADVEELAVLFKDNEYDVVVIKHCLNTVKDWRETVRQMFRIANKKVIIIDHSLQNETRLVDVDRECHNWQIGRDDLNMLARHLSVSVSYGKVGTDDIIIINKHLDNAVFDLDDH